MCIEPRNINSLGFIVILWTISLQDILSAILFALRRLSFGITHSIFFSSVVPFSKMPAQRTSGHRYRVIAPKQTIPPQVRQPTPLPQPAAASVPKVVKTKPRNRKLQPNSSRTCPPLINNDSDRTPSGSRVQKNTTRMERRRNTCVGEWSSNRPLDCRRDGATQKTLRTGRSFLTLLTLL